MELERLSKEFHAALHDPGLNVEETMVEVRKYRAHQERLLPILKAEMKANLIDRLNRKARDGAWSAETVRGEAIGGRS
jgi:hypothetical protein